MKQNNENIFITLPECKCHSAYATLAVLTLLSMRVQSCPHYLINI